MNEEIEFHISEKYEILQVIGKGAYGIVWKAIDKRTKESVALKKVFEAFQNETDAQRTFREVVILLNLKNHENIIKIIDVIKAENKKDIYLVFEFMQSDVHSVIKSGILKSEHKQFIIYQILKAIKYLHSGGIFHRDLKPSNVLINSDCYIKICDFGLARSIATEEEANDAIMTEYVATRWYRAPEIVFGSRTYNKSVDMWSIGCILGELINGNPLFPGKSTMGQIQCIVELLGKPSIEDAEAMDSENIKAVLGTIKYEHKISFCNAFKTSDHIALDFLKRSLEFNPNKRMTIDEALEHDYVKAFRELSEESEMSHLIVIPNNDKKLSIRAYREALYEETIKNVASLSTGGQKNEKRASLKALITEQSFGKPQKSLLIGKTKPILQSNEKKPINEKDKSRSRLEKETSTALKTSVNKVPLSSQKYFANGSSTQGKVNELLRNFMVAKKEKVPMVSKGFIKVSLASKIKSGKEVDLFAQKLNQIKSKFTTEANGMPKKQSSLSNFQKIQPVRIGTGLGLMNSGKLFSAKQTVFSSNEKSRLKFSSNEKKVTEKKYESFGVEKNGLVQGTLISKFGSFQKTFGQSREIGSVWKKTKTDLK